MEAIYKEFFDWLIISTEGSLDATWTHFWNAKSLLYSLPLVDNLELPFKSGMLDGKKILFFVLDMDDDEAVERVHKCIRELSECRLLKFVFCSGVTDDCSNPFPEADYILMFPVMGKKSGVPVFMFEAIFNFVFPFCVYSALALGINEIEDAFNRQCVGKHFSLEINRDESSELRWTMPDVEYGKLFLSMTLPINMLIADYAQCLKNIGNIYYTKTILGAVWDEHVDRVKVNCYFT